MNTMESAMTASSGACGTSTKPSVAAASVKLWANVKPLAPVPSASPRPSSSSLRGDAVGPMAKLLAQPVADLLGPVSEGLFRVAP